MIKAADLLSQRDLTVASIAAMVGYRSVAAFTSAFTRVAGTTPGPFRREYVQQSAYGEIDAKGGCDARSSS